ncbi:hypothetical protein F5877DRAFT_81230 [Lentinula edodes]|nr:hypothetical protein F5877DRAFT_81230 [Lentinula edodes]
MSKTPPRRKPSDPHASEHFQSTSIAYQTLPVPALRSKYNEFDTRESATESVFVDPEEVFGKIFSGERSVGVIGNISLARRGGVAGETFPKDPTALNSYKPSPSTTSSKQTHSSQPTNLPSVSVAGYIMYKANTMLSLKHNVSTLRATLDLKSVFDQIQAAGKAETPHLPRVRNSLEEQPAGKGPQALFKGAKLGVDSVLREVCDMVLEVEEDTNGIKGKGCVEGCGVTDLG